MTQDELETIRKIYIRVCRDSRFQMEPENAARFAASVAGCAPMDVLAALGHDAMTSIANGTHPCLARTRQESRFDDPTPLLPPSRRHRWL